MFKNLNSEIAELIGMHVGDGTLYNTNRGLVWEIRGSLNEKSYYCDNVAPLIKSIFGLYIKPKFRSGGKNGCFGLQTSKKNITSFFIDYNFKAGRKTHAVNIPDYIKDSNNKIKFAFIRGLFDTDGCLRFDKNKSILHKYPKIEFSSASSQLIMDLSLMLKDLGFGSYTWKDKTGYKLCIPGRKHLERWIRDIRPKNTKHLNKYLIFRKLGYMPKAGVAQPGTART